MKILGKYLLLPCCMALGGLWPPAVCHAADTAPPETQVTADTSTHTVAKPDLGAPGTPPASAADKDSATQLRQEIAELRADLQMLQSTLDLMVNQIMGDLRKENDQLRQEVRRLNTQHLEAGFPAPVNVPRPEAVESALMEAAPNGQDGLDANGDPPPPPPPPPPVEFTFNVVKEWGRDAGQARELGKDAGTLKGIIGLVPEGSLQEDLEKLGRELRSKYDTFDNVNVEVFDNEEVANRYASNEKGDPAHRVLIVQRHKASGRDIILYLNKGEATEVPPEPGMTPDANPPPDMPAPAPGGAVAEPAPPQAPPAETAPPEKSPPLKPRKSKHHK